MSNPDRLVLRATAADYVNLNAVALALRTDRRPFPTRADVVRHCLATVAASVAAPVDARKI